MLNIANIYFYYSLIFTFISTNELIGSAFRSIDIFHSFANLSLCLFSILKYVKIRVSIYFDLFSVGLFNLDKFILQF
jgi:hypothetical protein